MDDQITVIYFGKNIYISKFDFFCLAIFHFVCLHWIGEDSESRKRE